MALSLLDRNLPKQAIKCLQRLKQIDPTHAEVHYHLAHAFWLMDQHEEARKTFLKQLRRHPRDVQCLIDLGRLLVEMGRKADAGEKFRIAIELEPQRYEPYYELGCLSLNNGHLDAAQLNFQKALGLEPDSAELRLRLAEIALRQDQLERGRRLLLQLLEALDADPQDDAPLLEGLAQLLQEAGLYDLAVKVLAPLCAAQPQCARLWQSLAAAHLLNGQTHRGILACRKTLKLTPHDLPTMHNLILAHLHLSQLRRASYWLGRATKLDPQQSDTRRLRAHLWCAQLRRLFRR